MAILAVLNTVLLNLTGCSTLFGRRADTEETPVAETQADGKTLQQLTQQDKDAQITDLNKKVEALEEKIAGLSDKLNSAQSHIEILNQSQKMKTTTVGPSVVDQAGTVPAVENAENSPKAEISSNESIDRYRNAMILFEGGKYPEAMLEFNAFLKSYPDHVFAGSAQFYMGECYYKQGELKLAAEEFQRVVSSYDQSSHVPDALMRLSMTQDGLKQPKQAIRNRQLLLSLFPQSPAAKEVLEAKGLPAEQDVANVDAVLKNAAKQLAEPTRAQAGNAEMEQTAEHAKPATATTIQESEVPTAPAH